MVCEQPPATAFRLGISHWYSADNLGDVAILGGQLRMLNRSGLSPCVVIGVDRGVTPPPGARGCAFTCVPWPNPATFGLGPWLSGFIWAMITLIAPRARWRPAAFREFVEVLSGLDAVMAKGGGYLYSRSGLRGVLFTLRICWPLLLARRLGVRRLVWGHSIGPADTWLGALLLRAAIRGADVIVRDDASRALLDRWGIPHKRVPDFAFAYAPYATSTDHRRVQGDVILGLTARTIGPPAEQAAYEDALVAAIDALHDDVRAGTGRDMRLLLLAQVTGPLPEEDDRPVLRRIGQRVRCECVPGEFGHGDVEQALRRYGELDFLIATRLHSALLASCVTIPFVVYEYIGAKARGVIRDLGLPEWVVIDEPSKLPELARRGWRDRDRLVASYVVSLPRIAEELTLATAEGLQMARRSLSPAGSPGAATTRLRNTRSPARR
ncbi:MAG: polysaccharide pyruvyl transferase family protein [Solirubrobacteraceae bacterium]